MNLTLVGALIGLSLVCATVLAAVHVIPGDVVAHLVTLVIGGTLVYLNPAAKVAP